MNDPTLFPLPDLPDVEEPEKLSAGARLTLRRRRMLAARTHPVTRGPTRPDLGTCGDCEHSYWRGEEQRRFWKCDLVPVTFGPGTDIRVSWPACEKHEPRTTPTST